MTPEEVFDCKLLACCSKLLTGEDVNELTRLHHECMQQSYKDGYVACTAATIAAIREEPTDE